VADSSLVDRLRQHTVLAGVPVEQLEWLASHGELRQMAKGEIVYQRGEPNMDLFVMLSGRLRVDLSRGGGPGRSVEWRAGDVTGYLPYSRMTQTPGIVEAIEPCDVLVVERAHFPEMIRSCYELTSVFVHVMIDRARLFRSNELLDERMMSLGRLSAGLAHELNNPASAVERSAKSLASCLVGVDEAARALGTASISPAQLAVIDRIRDSSLSTAFTAPGGVEQLEREDEMAEWLARTGVTGFDADTLAETSISVAQLDELAGAVGKPALDIALRYLTMVWSVRKLAREIEIAATRIHDLVTAVKGFTYMDQATSPKPVDIGRGLSDTLTVHKAKARQKAIELKLEIEPDLPSIEAYGGELNQVWTNLIDNALDAAPRAGHVIVTAARDRQSIVVRVIDDGSGVPAAIRDRIFEPFFTTKRVGEGTGLGLDIARRLVERHEGAIEVRSQPGRTEFAVTLPLKLTPKDDQP
jgi:signal transduction histidine kinase